MSPRQSAPAQWQRRRRRLHPIGTTLLITTLLDPPVASACSVCYGDPESNLTQGAFAGVMVLGLIAYGVLMGMFGIGVTWFVRARKLRAGDPG